MAVDRDEPGKVVKSFISNGTAEFEYVPRKGHAKSVFWTIPTQPGTVQLFRRDPAGILRQIGAAVAVAANAEDSQEVDFPIYGPIVVRFTNNNATTGRVSFEATDDGGT